MTSCSCPTHHLNHHTWLPITLRTKFFKWLPSTWIKSQNAFLYSIQFGPWPLGPPLLPVSPPYNQAYLTSNLGFPWFLNKCGKDRMLLSFLLWDLAKLLGFLRFLIPPCKTKPNQNKNLCASLETNSRPWDWRGYSSIPQSSSWCNK